MTTATASGNGNISYTVGRYAIPVILLVLWEIIYFVVGEPAMASPLQTVSSLVTNVGAWLPDVGATLWALLISFVLSAIVGVMLGLLIGLSTFWTQVLGPIMVVLYAIPKVTLYPIFLLLFGLSLQGRVAFSAFHGVFPILIICMEATRGVPDTYLKVGDSYRMSFLQKARHILIPSIMPQLVVGLRTGFNLCFLGLILGEMFASTEGIGHRLMSFVELNRAAPILALILIIVFIAFLFTFLFLFLQERQEQKMEQGGKGGEAL